MSRKRQVVALALILGTGAAVRAQGIVFDDARPAAHSKGHVVLLSDGVSVQAGEAEYVELRFRVDDGYHINSHAPLDSLLIPTQVKLPDAVGIRVLAEEYPRGSAFKLGSGADARALDVYQGEFRVRVKLRAERGGQTMFGSLHYQACDDASCFPPKTLDFQVAVNAK
jgi:DsbC/DsbD-like thiol-disulfide interchange protein